MLPTPTGPLTPHLKPQECGWVRFYHRIAAIPAHIATSVVTAANARQGAVAAGCHFPDAAGASSSEAPWGIAGRACRMRRTATSGSRRIAMIVVAVCAQEPANGGGVGVPFFCRGGCPDTPDKNRHYQICPARSWYTVSDAIATFCK